MKKLKNLHDLTNKELEAELARRIPKSAPTLPAPVVLTNEEADKAASLKRLIDGVDVVVGVLNGTVHAANNQFWQEAKAHHNLDTDAFVWSVEDGVLMPSHKPPAGQPLG